MNLISKTATAAALLALSAAPAYAAGQPTDTPNRDNNPGTEKRADNPGAAKRLAAPGQYCKAESKKKAEGQKRSDFSTCVLAQRKLRSDKADSPREACKGADKKHVKGEKGTAFSRCVAAGAKLLKDQKAQREQTEESA